MSRLTHVIIACSSCESVSEDEDVLVVPAINHINAALDFHLKEITSTGGDKEWCEPIFAGCFNYLNLEKFMKLVNEAQWAHPESVTILVKGEDDEQWVIYYVKGEGR